MHEVLVALKPESPLQIGGVKVSASYLDTLTYLPGSALRGALAEWLIRNGRQGQIPSHRPKDAFWKPVPITN
jgi:CRISPR-associated protein Csx10